MTTNKPIFAIFSKYRGIKKIITILIIQTVYRMENGKSRHIWFRQTKLYQNTLSRLHCTQVLKSRYIFWERLSTNQDLNC